MPRSLKRLDPLRLERASALRRAFRQAEPFEHLALDGFVDEAFRRALLCELPPASRMRPVGGYGRAGRRFACRDVASLGPAFAALDRALRGKAFLRWAGRIAGHALGLNPAATCGGLFRDSDGMELDPHLDVNCTVPGKRRAMALLLYLNQRWEPGWGGALELFEAPDRPAARAIAPLPGRCVLMACHEESWHGYQRIRLPAAVRARGRVVFILNFYARAPVAKAAPAHYNTWMPRPLPERIRAERPLTAGDVRTVRRLLARRDALLRDLRALEGSRGAADAPAPELRPARALGTEGLKRLRLAFSRRDAELRRLYRLEFGYRSLAA